MNLVEKNQDWLGPREVKEWVQGNLRRIMDMDGCYGIDSVGESMEWIQGNQIWLWRIQGNLRMVMEGCFGIDSV